MQKYPSSNTRVLRFVADAPSHRRKVSLKFPFLSSVDNVPFDDTLRAKGYSYFCGYYTPIFDKTQAF